MIAVTVCLVCGAVVDKGSSAGRGSWASSGQLSLPRVDLVNNTGRARTRQDYGHKSGSVSSHDVPLDAAALPLGQPAPDAEPLIVLKRVLKALGADLATPADSLRLPGGAALLWEERLRVCLRAERSVLPTQVIHVLWTDRNLCQRDDDLSHSASSLSEPPLTPAAIPVTARITPMKLHPRVLL